MFSDDYLYNEAKIAPFELGTFCFDKRSPALKIKEFCRTFLGVLSSGTPQNPQNGSAQNRVPCKPPKPLIIIS